MEALALNDRLRPRSPQRERARKLLLANPKMSTEKVAATARVSLNTASLARSELVGEFGERYTATKRPAVARRMMRRMAIDLIANAHAVADIDPLEVDPKEARADIREILESWQTISEFINKVQEQLL